MTDTSPHEKIFDIFESGDGEIETRITDALTVGAEYLDMDTCFLARYRDGSHEITQSVSEHELIQPGETHPIKEAHYGETLGTDGILSVQGDSVSGPSAVGAIERIGFQSYICAQVEVNGDTYGLVCFADTSVRPTDFSTVEETFVSLFAKLTGQAIERGQYRRELAEQRERYQEDTERLEVVAKENFEVLFRLDSEKRFTEVSSAIQYVLGYEQDDLLGSPFVKYTLSASAGDALKPFLHNEEQTPVTLDFVDTDGQVIVVDIIGEPILQQGQITGVHGYLRDVTAQRRPEQELLVKNQAMNEADVGICIADNQRGDTPLVYVNEGFERLTGYEAHEVIGNNCRFLQGEATDPESVSELRESIEKGVPTSVSLVNYRKDDLPFWNRVQITPIRSNDDEVEHFLGFQTDITEEKRNEQLLAVLNRVLRHNLRNDMNLIEGYSDLIQEGIDRDDTALAEKIESTANELIELSDQALELERDSRNERVLKRLDVEEVFSEIGDDATAQYPNLTVEMTVDTDRNVCAGAEVDEAFRELIENSVKHNDGGDPWVEIDATTSNDSVVITVEDNGPGVSSMESDAIAHGSETSLTHGSGLGLWMVNWIVTRYGGSFQIEAKDGHNGGTIATVKLPGIGPEESIEEASRRPTALFL